MASSSSASAMPSTSSCSSSTRAAASSSLAPAGRVDDADVSSSPAPAPAPGSVDDVAFPRLGTAPPRPPRGGRAAPPPPPLRGSEARRQGGKTPTYTFDRDTVTLSLDSLFGNAPGTAATAEAAGPTVGTAEAAGPTVGTAEAVDAPSGNTSTGDAEPGTTSQSGVAPGRVAAESAVVSGAPTLPAVQAFAFGDLFEVFRSSRSPTPQAGAAAAPPTPQLQAPRYLEAVALQGPLQAPRYLEAVALQGPLQPPPLQAPRYHHDLVPLQGPPPQFAPPGHAHYASAMQFAARPQHMRLHLYPPGRARLFVDVHWHFQATPPPIFFEPRPQYAYTSLLPLPGHPQGALQRAYPLLPPVGHVGSLCWDCQVRPARTPFPCGHFFLCRPCYQRRVSCPCCTGEVPSPF